ncbi:helix-turn-helix transcriptional regulator [Streptomyces europaeiscabiei]|uniref:helix-turn-helix transcriptional regulator n=1 Tax=Streptomyces europaeiscabiei TaxID=146819 RepID=UPI002E16885D|nr:AAA family ATPase [Streptomyces europaeiscabiei]
MGRGFEVGRAGRGIVGRDGELARVGELLAGETGAGRLLIAVGEPGAGKSTLLDAAAEEAGRCGLRVLRVRGDEGEAELAFAGLHQLLRPVLDGARELPDRQRAALLGAFGLATAGPGFSEERPEPLLIHLATLTLLSDAAYRQPLFVVVDDAQWLDGGSLDTFAFVSRRLSEEPVAVLVGARTDQVPAQFGAEFGRLTVPPLPEEAADRLLDLQPEPPAGRVRAQILEQAGGNPLALVELARATAGVPGRPGEPGVRPALPDWSLGVLPLTARLEQIFAVRLSELPEATRRTLLLVAAAGDPDLPAALVAASATVPDGGLDVWLPAEAAGLIRLDSGHISFRHPLVRSAVYQAAPFTARREAHLALAEALAGSPDRQAWHLAAATLVPDEEIATALVATADRARRRGGYHAAAAALERAAQLSPAPEMQARRLVDAATMAMFAGRPRWVEEITARAAAATDDAGLLAEASLRAGWALAVTTRHAASLGYLLPIAESTAKTDPDRAIDALSTATHVIYNSGDDTYRQAALRIAASIGTEAGTEGDRLWAWVGSDPFGSRDERLRLLRRAAAVPDRPLTELVLLGAAAWALDETDTAVRLWGAALDHLRRSTTAGTNATVAQAMALAQYETGAWEAARSMSENARRVAVESGLEMAAAASGCVRAMLFAMRGDTDRARGTLAEVLAGIDLSRSGGLDARARILLGAAAGIDGNYAAAYEELRGLFTAGPDPLPLHYHIAYYGIADLAAAAVRAHRQDDARQVVDAVERRLSGRMSVRLAALLHRARALLSAPSDAERHFLAALADPAGDQWPFERAQTRLDHAEWLRRQRRTGEARPVLAQALAVFERLGARPWITRTVSELRACGVSAPNAERAASGSGELTAQQLQIARLAAAGLTNREIGERLLLSPRTIGFHLYQAFPKLAVSTRSQLREALDGIGDG